MKKTRCPKGFRRDKNGVCVESGKAKTKLDTEAEIMPEIPVGPALSEGVPDEDVRCPKGTVRDLNNGMCIEPEEVSPVKGRCPTGYRKNAKTGRCRKTTVKTMKRKASPKAASLLPKAASPASLLPKAEAASLEETRFTDKQPQKETTPIEEKDPNKMTVLDKEKREIENPLDEKQPYLYPQLGDPEFANKIAHRQEFAPFTYDGELQDIRAEAERLSNLPDFELSPHQTFVKNFMSFQTPYNTLLLYHGLGTGKTCSAIGIAEEMRDYMKQTGQTKMILVIASPNVQQNFRTQLFDETRLELVDGQWNLQTCIGAQLLKEINPLNYAGLQRDRVVAMIRTIINKSYEFMGYNEFANYIERRVNVPEDAGFTPEESDAMRTRNIKAHFNRRLVIIDEVQNIRLSDTNRKKRTGVLIREIAAKTDDMRLLLLSATPMYNNYNEIIWLANLMSLNDGRATIRERDVFDKDGQFRDEDLLRRKLTGYVSYVRGENPFTFPYRVYPNVFDPAHTLRKYPAVQMNGRPIEGGPIEFVPVYVNEIASYQYYGYWFILQDMMGRNFNREMENRTVVMPTFENMESFGYTLLMAPIEALNVVYPSAELDAMIQTKKIKSKNMANIIASFTGKNGMNQIVQYEEQENPYPIRYNYEYKKGVVEKYGRIFSPNEFGKYSHKISRICEILRKSEGVVLIYSQFIDGGVIPMALALEEMGFSRFSSVDKYNRNLFKKAPVPPVDAITLKPADTKKIAKYAMITGDKFFSPNNAEDLQYLTSKENANGELIRVVIISKAAAEGLDFKHIRQVHILDPWYNMNRTEQIIGRGVRNLSHRHLPFEKRNVEIYLHATAPVKFDDGEENETADLYVYRVAEKKAVQIGRVTRLMKEVAVDCVLNIGQTNYTVEKLNTIAANRKIKLQLSSGGLVDFKVGDRPFTDICDYMDNCAFKCSASSKPRPLVLDTYTTNYAESNQTILMKRIRDLFKERSVYNRKALIAGINSVKKYPIEQIYAALTRFVGHPSETVVDMYGRAGYMVNRGVYYAFQPREVTAEMSVYERTVPVAFKREKLNMELGEFKFAPPEMATPVGSSYDELARLLATAIKTFRQANLEVGAGEKDFFKHANKVREYLVDDHEIPIDTLEKYMVGHWLDTRSLDDRLTMAAHYMTQNASMDANVKQYISERMVGKGVVVFGEKDENKIYVWDENAWKPGEYSDMERSRGEIQKRFAVKTDRLAPIVGFMHAFKGGTVLFKTKDMTQKRNNLGARAETAEKKELCQKIYTLSGIDYMGERIEKLGICVILEMVMRHESGKVVHFLNVEQTIQTDLVKI